LDLHSLPETVGAFYIRWQSQADSVFILFGTLAATLVIHLLLRRRYQRPQTGVHVWRDAVLGALNAPLQSMAWVIGLSIVEGVLTTGGRLPLLAQMFPPVRDVAVVAIIAWFFIRLTRRATRNLYGRAKAHGTDFDETAADAIGKAAVATTIVIAALMMMQVLGFSITSLLAFGGVAGIALGFAAQGLVANLLGGITIYASRPFKVGDHVVFMGTRAAGGVYRLAGRRSSAYRLARHADSGLEWQAVLRPQRKVQYGNGYQSLAHGVSGDFRICACAAGGCGQDCRHRR
jgi:MscS family membrane protein